LRAAQPAHRFLLDAKVVAKSEATEVRGPPPIQNRLAGNGGSSSGRLRVFSLFRPSQRMPILRGE
jgi:hypothetical protein